MRKKLIAKIKVIIAKRKNMNEADTCYLMVLIRKVLEEMSQVDLNQYLTLKLFCNWVLHIKITESNTGLRILAKTNDMLVSFKDSADIDTMRIKMSHTIGFSALRKELKTFLDYIKIGNILISDNDIWANFLTNLIEVIRDAPLSFPVLSKLDTKQQKIYDQIAKNPIKVGAEVISIRICLMGSMCLAINTRDTTTILIPLLIDVRL